MEGKKEPYPVGWLGGRATEGGRRGGTGWVAVLGEPPQGRGPGRGPGGRITTKRHSKQYETDIPHPGQTRRPTMREDRLDEQCSFTQRYANCTAPLIGESTRELTCRGRLGGYGPVKTKVYHSLSRH